MTKFISATGLVLTFMSAPFVFGNDVCWEFLRVVPDSSKIDGESVHVVLERCGESRQPYATPLLLTRSDLAKIKSLLRMSVSKLRVFHCQKSGACKMDEQWLRRLKREVLKRSGGQIEIRPLDGQIDHGIGCTGHGPQGNDEELVAVRKTGDRMRFDILASNPRPFVLISRSSVQ
jgi:hypothetical protein